jgi:hypothetical protein
MQIDDGKPRSSQVTHYRAVKSTAPGPNEVTRTYRHRSEPAHSVVDFAGQINPWLPTTAPPGSKLKAAVLAARYAAGAPLWHPDDCLDHEAQSMKKLLDSLTPDDDDTDDDD